MDRIVPMFGVQGDLEWTFAFDFDRKEFIIHGAHGDDFEEGLGIGKEHGAGDLWRGGSRGKEYFSACLQDWREGGEPSSEADRLEASLKRLEMNGWSLLDRNADFSLFRETQFMRGWEIGREPESLSSMDPARLDANWLLWNAGGEGMARNDRLKQALEFGADPDSPNPGGWSGDAKLLFDVVDDPEARGLLLSHGAKADAIDEYGNSAWSHVRTAEAIEWAAGAIPLLIEAGGRHGTPAQEMAADGRLDLVLLMKEKGASMDPGGEEKSSVPVLLTASCFNSWRGELTEPDRLDDIAKAGMIEFAPGKDAHGQPGLFETAMKHAISEAQDFTTTAKNGCSWTTTSKPDFSLAMKLAGMSKGADPLSDFGSVQDAAESRLRKNTYEWTGKDFDPAARKIKSGILKEAIEGRIERGEPHLAAAIVLDSVEFARKAMDKGERPDQAMMDFSKDRGSGYWRGPKAKLTPSALDAMAAAADRKDLKKDLRVKAAKAGDDIGSALDNQKSKDRKNGPGQGPAQSSRRRI
jgi:hypothetical protein